MQTTGQNSLPVRYYATCDRVVELLHHPERAHCPSSSQPRELTLPSAPRLELVALAAGVTASTGARASHPNRPSPPPQITNETRPLGGYAAVSGKPVDSSGSRRPQATPSVSPSSVDLDCAYAQLLARVEARLAAEVGVQAQHTAQ